MQEDNHVYLCNMLFLNHHLNKMVNKPLDKIDFVASPWLQSSIIATFYNKVPYYFIKKNIKTSYVIFSQLVLRFLNQLGPKTELRPNRQTLKPQSARIY